MADRVGQQLGNYRLMRLLGRGGFAEVYLAENVQLGSAAAEKPDVIYFGGLDATGGTAIRQQMLQVQGLQNTPFVGGDGINTPTFATTIGANSGGPVYSTTAFLDV